LADLQLAIADKLIGIEDTIKAHGPDLPELTLIARKPGQEGMIVVVTSEKDGGRAALRHANRSLGK
jgi:hypothetical protein